MENIKKDEIIGYNMLCFVHGVHIVAERDNSCNVGEVVGKTEAS